MTGEELYQAYESECREYGLEPTTWAELDEISKRAWNHVARKTLGWREY